MLRRGFNIPSGSNVLVVEDVITTGKSALECSEIISLYKANLIGFACILNRSDSNFLVKKKIISQLKFKIDVFKSNELPEKLKKLPAVKPGSRNLSK